MPRSSLKQVTPQLFLTLFASNTQNYSCDNPESRQAAYKMSKYLQWCLLMATDWGHGHIIWEFQVSMLAAWTMATSSCLSLRTVCNMGRTWNKAARSAQMQWNLMLPGKHWAWGPQALRPVISVPIPLSLSIRTLTADHTINASRGLEGEYKAFLRYMVFYFEQCGKFLKFKH